MAIGEQRALFIDKETCARQDLTLVLDILILGTHVLERPIIVNAREIDEITIWQFHAIIELIDYQHDSRLGTIKQFLRRFLTATYQQQRHD